MPRRIQIGALVALLVLLVVILFYDWKKAPEAPTVSAAGDKYQPLPLENPSLRLDMLERIRKFEYTGRHRNIFSASLPPPEPTKADPRKVGPVVPTGPPPLDVPVKFFGYVADLKTGQRRAFFTNGEDVFIVAEGETLLSRFRLLRIGNNSAEVEEMTSGRRATLVLEETGPPA